jgi:hypothetical protein
MCRFADGTVNLRINFKYGTIRIVYFSKTGKQKGVYKDNRFQYDADGIIRLQDLHDIEICLSPCLYHT